MWGVQTIAHEENPPRPPPPPLVSVWVSVKVRLKVGGNFPWGQLSWNHYVDTFKTKTMQQISLSIPINKIYSRSCLKCKIKHNQKTHATPIK